MIYSDVIRDFARRTQVNLAAIEQLREKGNEVYEVTQLVNSMLGLLVFPQQEYMDRIPNTPLDELTQQRWPVPKVRGQFNQITDLNQLVRYLRNAIAHFNIKFVDDGQGSISLLRVWNKYRGKKTWEADLTPNDIREIAVRFIELLLSEDQPDGPIVQAGSPRQTYKIAEIRKDNPHANKPWSAEEDNRLLERHCQGIRIKELAVEFQRTEGAIRSRRAKLGLAKRN